MSFISNLIDEFTGKDKRQDEGPPGYYPQEQRYNQPQSYNGPPQVPPPWIAEWDGRDNRWLYINRETGERTFEFPQQRGYGGNNYGGNYGEEYRGQNQGGYSEPEPQKKSHTGRNVALGAAAGVVGGALLMEGGEKVEEKWDEDKYRMENSVSNGVQDVEDFPEDAARWTGEKVGEVENIPQDIENKWDNAVDDVEDVPDDVAGWAGRKVGDVERFGDDVDRFGDNVGNSYDQGRDDARYGDDY